MKGCTNYTDEATRWTTKKTQVITLPRVLLVGGLAVALVFAVIVVWPRFSTEGFSIAVAEEKAGEAASPSSSTSATAVSDTTDAATAAVTADASGAASATSATSATAAASPGDASQLGEDVLFTVYLTGAVAHPGVYELPAKARINDAIEQAGGLVEGSAANYVNLAARFQDGEHVHIPYLEEIESGEAARIAAAGASGAVGAVGGGGAATGDASTAADASGQTAAQAPQKVNINTADKTQLESLPGVGEATAQRIIDYREKSGGFKDIEDLKNVSGIGEKKYAELADKVCV
jgi:competence protein ComEA